MASDITSHITSTSFVWLLLALINVSTLNVSSFSNKHIAPKTCDLYSKPSQFAKIKLKELKQSSRLMHIQCRPQT